MIIVLITLLKIFKPLLLQFNAELISPHMKIAYLHLFIAIVFILQTTAGNTFQNNEITKIGIDLMGSTKLKNIIGDQKNRFYVDIGAYDPVFLSNTLQLQMEGWRGINVQPHYARFSRFVAMRPNQINLNFAVGSSNKYTILYSFNQSQVSSTNPSNEQKKRMTERLTVPSISLKDLCQKYYLEQPAVINIGAGDSMGQILQSNNWNNSKCLPDIFVLSQSEHKDQSQLESYKILLTKQQYSIFSMEWQKVDVFIKDNLIDKYRQNYINYSKVKKGKRMFALSQILSQISVISSKRIFLVPFTDTVNLYLAKKNEHISVHDINKFNNNPLQYYPIKQTKLNISSSIVILDYDIRYNSLIFSNCSFSIARIITDQFDIFNLTIFAHSSKQQFFIVANTRGLDLVPRILVADQRCMQAQVAGRYLPAADYQQGNGQIYQNRNFQLFQTAAMITFLIFFVIFSTLVLVYMCKSIRTEYRIQEQAANSVGSSQNTLQSSTIN